MNNGNPIPDAKVTVACTPHRQFGTAPEWCPWLPPCPNAVRIVDVFEDEIDGFQAIAGWRVFDGSGRSKFFFLRTEALATGGWLVRESRRERFDVV